MRQFLRYAVVGGTQNGTYLVLFAAALAVGVPLVPATLIGAAAAITLSFTLNRRWTFGGTDDRTAQRVLRYAVVWLAFVAASIPILVVLVKVLHVSRVGAQALIICVGAPLSYLVQRHWTFGPTHLDDAKHADSTPVIADGEGAAQASDGAERLETACCGSPSHDGTAAA